MNEHTQRIDSERLMQIQCLKNLEQLRTNLDEAIKECNPYKINQILSIMKDENFKLHTSISFIRGIQSVIGFA